jgi:hypothetical protein
MRPLRNGAHGEFTWLGEPCAMRQRQFDDVAQHNGRAVGRNFDDVVGRVGMRRGESKLRQLRRYAVQDCVAAGDSPASCFRDTLRPRQPHRGRVARGHTVPPALQRPLARVQARASGAAWARRWRVPQGQRCAQPRCRLGPAEWQWRRLCRRGSRGDCSG